MAISAGKALTALRISIGCIFLIFAEYKVFGTQFTLHGGFQYWINLFIAGGAYPFMLPVLKGFVLPHATAIAFVVAYCELAIGLSLVLGFWFVLLAYSGRSICSRCCFPRTIRDPMRPFGNISAHPWTTQFWRFVSPPSP
jgi:uncharacterized membrane protein YphA (DoxX/SURF4 family)